MHPRSSPTEYIGTAHALEPGFVVLQTARYEHRGTGGDRVWELVGLRTYLVDQETGNGGLVSDELPRIAWIGDSRYVAAWSFPYPRVEVRLMPRMDSRHTAQER